MNANLPAVLLVDDDYFTVECLKTLIDWESVGMRLVGYAYDGVVALHKIQELNPDVLITDISMPFMSGLELTEKALALRKGLYVILLTSYEDFSFARQGIELGADAYIVKHVDYGKLSMELQKYRGRIHQKLNLRRKQIEMQKHESILLEELAAVWLRENDIIKYEQLCSLEGFQSVIKCSDTAVMVVDCGDPIAMMKRDGALTGQDAARIAALWLSEHMEGIVFRHRPFAIGLLTTGKNLDKEAPELRCYIKNSYGVDVVIGLGKRMPIKDASISLADAEQGILAVVFGEKAALQSTDEIKQSESFNMLRMIRQYSWQFAESIRDNLEQLAAINALEYTRAARKLTKCSYPATLFLLKICYAVLPQDHKFLQILVDALDLSVDNKIDTLEKDVQTAIGKWFRQASESTGRTASLQVRKMVQWVDEHIEEELTLRRLSEVFLISPNHMGRIFREETGEPFSDFVLKRKLEGSCKYLDDPTYKVYEIADRMGFKNMSYFHSKFQERFGCTPGEYRKKKS